jgi:hypothetical protein
MRRLFLVTCSLVAALPLWPVAAASPLSRTASAIIPLNYALAPGMPILKHSALQRFFSYNFGPGQSYTDVLAVINLSRKGPLRVTLRVSDGSTPHLGAGIVFNSLGSQRAIGRWIQLGRSAVTVPAYSITFVPLTIHIPSSLQPGEYRGAIDAINEQGMTATQGNVHSTIHGDVRCLIYLRVKGRASAGLHVVQVAMDPASGPQRLNVTLQNPGTVIDYSITAAMTFVGPRGTYTMPALVGDITAGDSTTVTLNVDRTIPPGRYEASIRMTYFVALSYRAPVQRHSTSWHGTVAVPTS